MTGLNVIENKISSIQKYLKILVKLQKYSLQEIQTNDILRGAVERYLYLVTQATIDLAEAVIALNHYRKPSVYSESFDILCEENIITVKLTEEMVKMTGFRNFIAHDYDKINFQIIYDVLQNKLKDIKAFIKAVEVKIL